MEPAPDWRASNASEEPAMTNLSKTLIAAAAFATIATAAFSQVVWEFNPGMAYMYAGPGKMSAMAMASGEKNHDAMMKHANKVPANTVFFMHNNELYSVSGTLDPTGNFYRP
jgi:hypothetical protein